MKKTLLSVLVLLFFIFVVPMLIVSFCGRIEPCIKDFEDASLDSIEFVIPVECGLRD